MDDKRLIEIYKEASKYFYSNQNNTNQKSKHWERYNLKEFTLDINYNDENSKEFDNIKIKKMLNNYLDQINRCTILTPNNEIHHNCINSDCSSSFINKDNKNEYDIGVYYNLFSYFSDNYKNKGIFLHTDCWKYIKKNIINLQYILIFQFI